MTVEEYKQLWKEAIHLCEIEPDKEEATSFVYRFYDKNPYGSMSERELLLTFVGLVVYEKKFQLKFGSTTPASFCFRELLPVRQTDSFPPRCNFVISVANLTP